MLASYEPLKICMTRPRVQSYSMAARFRSTVGVRRECLHSPTLYNIFLERIMCEALDDNEGKCRRGRRSWRPGRPARYNHHKIQNRNRPRQDKSDDKQPKWLSKRVQDKKKSEARRSGELQVSWSNHLQRRIKTRDSFQDSPDNSSSF